MPNNFFKSLKFFFFFLLSFLFVFSLIIPSSVKAASCSLVLDSVYICSNTPIITYPNDCFAGSTTYVGNWRFRARVRNAGTESVSGTYTVFSWPYSTVFTYDLTLGPSEFRDFNDTSTGWICDHIEFSADCDAGGGATTNFQLSGAGLCPGAPTPTRTPTPTVGIVVDPPSCTSTQQTGFSGSGTPLVNNYNSTQYNGSPQYTNFTASKTGKISKAEIYGTLDRDVARGNKVLQCKITNADGTTTLRGSTTNNGPFSKGTSWFPVSFTTPVNVVKGTAYRLYCKVNNVAGGGYLYWLDYYNNRTTKTFRLSTCN